MTDGARQDLQSLPAGEFARIDRYLKPLAAGFPGALGLTDDAGLVDVPPGHQLVVTTDAMIAGVHFLPGDPPADIAFKLLSVNLSDLAAKGAEPLAYSLVTALPRQLPEDWLSAFATGLGEAQNRWGIHLLGGDSVSTAGPIGLTVSALGLVPDGRMVRRSGARAGDLVLVSGTVGDAALGLRIAREEELGIPSSDAAYLLRRLRRPEPRLPLAHLLRDHATAAVDLSDGLVADLGHLAAASGVGITIYAARIPLSAAASPLVAARPDLLPSLLTGGDDYEVAFTAPAGLATEIAICAKAAGVDVTAIGEVEARAGVTVYGADGTPIRFDTSGWSHF